MHDCIFCKIIAGEIPAKMVYEDEQLVAFHDIAPKASTHVLVVPRQHYASLNDFQNEDADLLAHMMLTLPKIAKTLGLDTGFRTIINTGVGGGQEVFHLHVHLLGGQLPSFG